MCVGGGVGRVRVVVTEIEKSEMIICTVCKIRPNSVPHPIHTLVFSRTN